MIEVTTDHGAPRFTLQMIGLLSSLHFFLANDPREEIRHTRRHQLLGSGGPDDPFANDPYDD